MLLRSSSRVLVLKCCRVWEYECFCQSFVSVTMRSINLLLGGSFGVRDSDSYDLNRSISENSLRRRELRGPDILVYFGIDSCSIGNNKIKTYYIDKISSPCLLCLIAAKML